MRTNSVRMRLWLVAAVAAVAATAAAGASAVSGSDTITTIAGNGTIGSSGDGGPATSASVSLPHAVAVDRKGNVYISVPLLVRKVSRGGRITTIAGGASMFGVAVDTKGYVFFADPVNNRVRRVSPGGKIVTIAGTGKPGFSGDKGPATAARLDFPIGLAVDKTGNVYIADAANNRVRKVSRDAKITTIAGSGLSGTSPAGYSGASGPATSARLNRPSAVAVDRKGNIYIADGPRVRKVSPGGRITTFAGTQETSELGDGGPATSAHLGGATGIAVDGKGNVYIATSARVRKVNPRGKITTIAGTGKSGYSGDGGPASLARLGASVAVAADRAGNVYIADTLNNRVRKVGVGAAAPGAAAPSNLIGDFTGKVDFYNVDGSKRETQFARLSVKAAAPARRAASVKWNFDTVPWNATSVCVHHLDLTKVLRKDAEFAFLVSSMTGTCIPNAKSYRIVSVDPQRVTIQLTYSDGLTASGSLRRR